MTLSPRADWHQDAPTLTGLNGGGRFPPPMAVAIRPFGVMVLQSGAGARTPLARGQASGVRARDSPAEPRDGLDGAPNHRSI